MKEKIELCKNIAYRLSQHIENLINYEKYSVSISNIKIKEIERKLLNLKEKSSKINLPLKKTKLPKKINVQDELKLIEFCEYNSLIKAEFHSYKIITNSVIVMAISLFDSYLKDVLNIICHYLGVHFQNKNISVLFNEIRFCKNQNEIEDYCINKYLETLFSDSRKKVFDEIKNYFHIDDIKQSDFYKDFVFLAETRNIIVHNDSRINNIFKSRLSEEKIDYKKYRIIEKEGDVILKETDFKFVFDTTIIFSLYLSLTIIKHYIKNNCECMALFLEDLNSSTLNLFYSNKNYTQLAIKVYDEMIKYSTDSSDKFVYTINKCIGLKILNLKSEIDVCLNTLDWSNCDEQFVFAKNCLLNKYDECISFLKKSDNKDEWLINLKTWPLCCGLIRSNVFRKNKFKIFGKLAINFK